MGTWASLIELLFEPKQLLLRLLEMPLIPPQNLVEQWSQFIMPILTSLTSSATTLMASCLQFLFSSLLAPGYLKILISLRYYHLKLTPQSPTLLVPIALMKLKSPHWQLFFGHTKITVQRRFCLLHMLTDIIISDDSCWNYPLKKNI